MRSVSSDVAVDGAAPSDVFHQRQVALLHIEPQRLGRTRLEAQGSRDSGLGVVPDVR